MLSITRKIREKIIINDNITIVVQEIYPGRIRLGFEAPQDVRIMREELIEREGDVQPKR